MRRNQTANALTERGEALEHLVLQFVAVDSQQDVRLVRLRCAEEPPRRLDHGVGLAAALCVPDDDGNSGPEKYRKTKSLSQTYRANRVSTRAISCLTNSGRLMRTAGAED